MNHMSMKSEQPATKITQQQVFTTRPPLQSWVEDTRPGDRSLGRAALSENMSYCSSANIGGGVR